MGDYRFIIGAASIEMIYNLLIGIEMNISLDCTQLLVFISHYAAYSLVLI